MPDNGRTAATPAQRAIAADIAITRDRMGATVDEIAARLAPDRLKREAKQAVRDATIGRVQGAARRTAGGLRRHRRPIALVAAGAVLIGWLFHRAD